MVRNKWVLLFLGILATLFGTMCLMSYSHTQTLLVNGGNTTGTVVRLESSSKGAYYPVVRFKTEQGEEFVTRSTVGSSPPGHQVGDTVAVIYNKTNPKDWCVKSWLSLYFLPTMFGAACGALIIAMTIVAIFSNRRRFARPIQ